MYKIERHSYGYKLTMSGYFKVEEMKNWVEDSRKALANENSKNFGVFVDMRDLKPLAPEAKAEMQVGQKLYKEKGMHRSVVILANRVIKMQFVQIAKETGIYQFERYIDAESTPDWEKVGVAWLVSGTDPDL